MHNKQQTWEPKHYEKHARYVTNYGRDVVDLLNPQKNESILDLGCGDGVLTKVIQEYGAKVIGIDASPDMIHAAQARGLDVHVMDAHQLPFNETFDAVFSNAALHWMLDPDAVLKGVARALKKNGRFVAEQGGTGNVQHITNAISTVLTQHNYPDPVPKKRYYPTKDEQYTRLTQAGFTVSFIQLFPRPTPLPTGMIGWLKTFAKDYFYTIPTPLRESYYQKISQLLKPILLNQNQWYADYVRLRWIASKQ